MTSKTPTEAREELLPCPFCGTDDFVRIHEPELGYNNGWLIGCFAQMEGGCGYVGEWNTKSIALNSWNTRFISPNAGDASARKDEERSATIAPFAIETVDGTSPDITDELNTRTPTPSDDTKVTRTAEVTHLGTKHGTIGASRFADYNFKIDFDNIKPANSLTQALELAASTFRRYEALHRAKPDEAKADANRDLAVIMEQTLSAFTTDTKGG